MAANEINLKSTTLPPGGCYGNKPHKCDICGRRFVSHNGLEDHVRTHYDEYFDSLTPNAEASGCDDDSNRVDEMPALEPFDNDRPTGLDQMPMLEPIEPDCSTGPDQIPIAEPHVEGSKCSSSLTHQQGPDDEPRISKSFSQEPDAVNNCDVANWEGTLI